MARTPADERVRQARRLTSADDARALYRDWAAHYDDDIAGELRFTGGADIAHLLARHLEYTSAKIIDIGCGTGLVGAELTRLGYRVLHGLDQSPEMLSIAGGKAIYQRLIEADLNLPLGIDDHSYDAAISAGTFTSGHVGADRLDEVIRIIRPGGMFACVIASDVWLTGGFASRIEHLVEAGRLTARANEVNRIAATSDAEAHFVVAEVNG